MRVAIATDDRQTLNGHFAVSHFFLFYDVTEESCHLVNEMCFTPSFQNDGQTKPTRKPFQIDERIEAIKGCDVIIVSAIGGPIADRVIANDVYPLEMNAPEAIDVCLSKLQALLGGRQPLWLKRIINHDFMSERT
jgi:nitrogen fixation protein NifX